MASSINYETRFIIRSNTIIIIQENMPLHENTETIVYIVQHTTLNAYIQIDQCSSRSHNLNIYGISVLGLPTLLISDLRLR